eukprot:7189176-Karenia_brevis.AAC.1
MVIIIVITLVELGSGPVVAKGLGDIINECPADELENGVLFEPLVSVTGGRWRERGWGESAKL